MYWITMGLGAIFGISPYLFNYSDNAIALWGSIIIGAVVVIVSVIEALSDTKQDWEYVITAVLGLGAITFPFVFNFSDITNAVWAFVIGGAAFLVLSGGKIIQDNQSNRIHASA